MSFVGCLILAFIGSDLSPVPTSQNSSIPPSTSTTSSLSAPIQKGWSKQNLKNGERRAWTRGRDGWSPVVGNSSSNVGGASTGLGSGVVEGSGEIRFVLVPPSPPPKKKKKDMKN